MISPESLISRLCITCSEERVVEVLLNFGLNDARHQCTNYEQLCLECWSEGNGRTHRIFKNAVNERIFDIFRAHHNEKIQHLNTLKNQNNQEEILRLHQEYQQIIDQNRENKKLELIQLFNKKQDQLRVYLQKYKEITHPDYEQVRGTAIDQEIHRHTLSIADFQTQKNCAKQTIAQKIEGLSLEKKQINREIIQVELTISDIKKFYKSNHTLYQQYLNLQKRRQDLEDRKQPIDQQVHGLQQDIANLELVQEKIDQCDQKIKQLQGQKSQISSQIREEIRELKTLMGNEIRELEGILQEDSSLNLRIDWDILQGMDDFRCRFP